MSLQYHWMMQICNVVLSGNVWQALWSHTCKHSSTSHTHYAMTIASDYSCTPSPMRKFWPWYKVQLHSSMTDSRSWYMQHHHFYSNVWLTWSLPCWSGLAISDLNVQSYTDVIRPNQVCINPCKVGRGHATMLLKIGTTCEHKVLE